MPLVEKSIGYLFVVEKDRSSMHHVTQVENTLGSGRILIHNCHATMNGPAFENTREHGSSEGFPFQIHVVRNFWFRSSKTFSGIPCQAWA